MPHVGCLLQSLARAHVRSSAQTEFALVYLLHNMRAQSVYCPCVVTAKTQYNLKNAREYFEEHLCVGDYYDEGQRVAGEWIGWARNGLGCPAKSAPMISCGCAKISIPPVAKC